MSKIKNGADKMGQVATNQDIQYQTSKLKAAQQQKIKNLTFFKTFHPGIYNRFSEYVLDQYKVSLNTEIDQLDILINGKSIYNNRPIAEAKESLYEFDSNFAPGKVIRTIKPPFGGYDFPRFFHKRCADLITKSPLKRSNYKGYKIPDFYPLIIFNGVGSGYHLEMFLESRSVINCLIVEPSPELFACSLYLIDWEEICKPFVNDPDKNIHFIVGPIETEDHLHGYIMRYLGSHCPIYPLTSLFINHKPLDLYKRVTKKINEDTNVFVSVWGFYDDELNQINNCLHNIHLGISKIQSNLEAYLELPIFIIGAGPSLDDRIEEIKSFQGKALVISCGTSIHSLYKHGIKPDIHFELESHLVTLKSLEELDDPEWVKSIPILGPAQLSPRLYQFFDKRVIYFKGESVTSLLFSNKSSSVYRGTPTCTNGALAVFSHWGFKNIFMFGMDFGYRDFTNHHASGSLYYTSNNEEILADANVGREAVIDVEAVDGTIIKTKPILFTAKRTAETTARAFEKFCKFYNCSNGAKMECTEWIKPGEMPINPEDVDDSLIDKFIDLQFNQEQHIDKAIIKNRLDVLDHNMGEVNNYIKNQLSSLEGNLYSMTCHINNISSFLDNKMRPEISPFYFFMRGSIWHLFYIGYSHALCIEDKKELKRWVKTWKKQTIDTLFEMNKHFRRVLYKEFDYESDPWTQRSTSDPED